MMRNFLLLGINLFFNLVYGQTIIWQNDFATASDWAISNNTNDQQDWVISTSTATTLGYGTGAWVDGSNTVTNENGYALFDSDAVGADGGNQDALMTYTGTVDCSGFPNVVLEFNQRIRMWQTTETIFEISNDGGTTWIPFSVNLDKNVSTLYQENAQINITSAAGGQANVKVRLRYIGSWDFAWLVDDLKIVDPTCTITPINQTQLISSCDSYSINGQTVTQSGNIVDTSFNIYGCPSVVNHYLVTINNSYNQSIPTDISICEGDTLNYNNQQIINEGIYYQNLQSIHGCDSNIIINVGFFNTDSIINSAICSGSNYWLNGTTYNQSGQYIQVLQSSQGCDSIITLNLVVLPPLSSEINASICPGSTYTLNGQTYSTGGTFIQSLQTLNGCDSLIYINLTIYPNNFNPTFSSSQQLYTSPPFAVQFINTTTNPSNYVFTWYWGDGTSTTSNNTNVFHQYLTNGLYTVTLEATSTSTGCTDQTTYTDYIYTTGGVSCTHSANIIQTGPINACSGQNVVLSCNSSSNYTYQWRRNGVYISGNNNDTLLVTQPGSYSVIISDNGCPVSSSEVTVNFSSISAPIINSNGSIQPCLGGSVTLTASSGYNSYLWSNGATTQSTTISSSGSYSVMVTNSNGCSITSAPFIVNASILPTQSICVVGIDSLTNNIRVIWEKPNTNAIDSFYVYRETAVSNVFAKVGSRLYDSLSVWLDPIANPAVQAYRYKITALDTCGSETPLSSFHKTIHLTINQGVGNAWNLIWSNYEGISFGSYNIYRGTSPSNLSLLTTIQSNLNSYTDLSAPIGNVYYQIEIVNPNNCNPTKSMNYSSSKSNIVNTNSSSVAENKETIIRVYPNPANDILIIESETSMNSRFQIIDAIGRTVYSGLLTSSKSILDINAFSRGSYTLIVENLGKPIRFIKQ
jgi:hypothetical protein